MNLRKILQELKAERRKLDAAILVLERLATKSSTRSKAARPRRTAKPSGDAVPTKRKLSAFPPLKGRLLLFPAERRRRTKSAIAQEVRSEKENGA